MRLRLDIGGSISTVGHRANNRSDNFHRKLNPIIIGTCVHAVMLLHLCGIMEADAIELLLSHQYAVAFVCSPWRRRSMCQLLYTQLLINC